MADTARLEMKFHELNDKIRAVLLRVERLETRLDDQQVRSVRYRTDQRDAIDVVTTSIDVVRDELNHLRSAFIGKHGNY